MTFVKQVAPVGVVGLLFAALAVAIVTPVRDAVPALLLQGGVSLVGYLMACLYLVLPLGGLMLYWGAVLVCLLYAGMCIFASLSGDTREPWRAAALGYFWLLCPLLAVAVYGYSAHGGWFVWPTLDDGGFLAVMIICWVILTCAGVGARLFPHDV